MTSLDNPTPPLVWITAYDYPTACILKEAEVDTILVGDSLGMTFAGYKDIKNVTLDMMCYHTEIVKRGAGKISVIGDMPYKSYDDPLAALASAKRFIESGADYVKLEGGKDIEEQSKVLINNGIRVVGHLGLTPQKMEKWSVQGKDKKSAQRILRDAKLLENIGISYLVLECIPEALGKEITEKISVPTIGIGAGRYVSGQVLVFNDLVGLTEATFRPKFLKRYADSRKMMFKSVKKFKKEVKTGKFPTKKESYM